MATRLGKECPATAFAAAGEGMRARGERRARRGGREARHRARGVCPNPASRDDAFQRATRGVTRSRRVKQWRARGAGRGSATGVLSSSVGAPLELFLS